MKVLSPVFAVAAMMIYTLAVTVAALWWVGRLDTAAAGLKEVNARIDTVVSSTTTVVRSLDERVKVLEAAPVKAKK